MELSQIKRISNRLDLKTVNSKYPWKNIYPMKNTNTTQNTKPRKKQKT